MAIKNQSINLDLKLRSTTPHPTGLIPLLSCPVYTATKHGVVGFTRAMSVRTHGAIFSVNLEFRVLLFVFVFISIACL